MKQDRMQLIFQICGFLFSITLIILCIWSTAVPSSFLNSLDDFPHQYFAPYVQVGLNTIGLRQIAQVAGAKFYILAFMVDDSHTPCQASWSGISTSANQGALSSDIRNLRDMGGDVSISFGGPIGNELALTCPDVSSLQTQYQGVIDRYGLTHIDFALADGALADQTSIDRRNKAIAALQASTRGKQPLFVSYTLPVTSSGLEYQGMQLLKNADDNGVTVYGVNIMAMDYGSATSPANMGKNAIEAVNNVFLQLKSLYPAKSSQQVWAMLGITPMIGQNDVDQEVFNLTDAQEVLSFAQSHHLHELSIWSLERDQAQTGTNLTAMQPYSFTRLFNQFTTPSTESNQVGGDTPAPIPTPAATFQAPTTVPTPTSSPTPTVVPTSSPTPASILPTTTSLPTPTSTPGSILPSPTPVSTSQPSVVTPTPTLPPTPGSILPSPTPVSTSQPSVVTPTPTLPPPHP